MELAFPPEFVVDGTPVSLQAARAEAKTEWKARIRNASRAVLPEDYWASEGRIAVTLFYFPATTMQGDLDNIVKLVLDALSAHIYVDDGQVERILVAKVRTWERVRVRLSDGGARRRSQSTEARALHTYQRPSVRGADVSLSVPKSAVLENVLPELEADGFEVYARPAAHLLPPFMQNYVPDAIALREGRKLAIEVLRDEPSARGRLGHIQELFSKQKDWELRVYWLSPSYGSQAIEAAPLESIDGAIESVQALAEEGRTAPALLMAWSIFEALGRLLLPGKFAKPQTPARLVEILAAEGQITPTEADRLRHLIQVRNKLVHGGLQATASTAELADFVRILRSLRGVAPSSIEGGRPQLS